MAKISKTERDEALANLRKWLKPGDTVYTMLERVSASGMSRTIRVLLIRPAPDTKEGIEILHPNYAVAAVLGYRLATKGDGFVVPGCGMDMGFHVVYSLGSKLWPAGTPEPHRHRNGEPDSSGGYALNHRWL